MSRAESPRRHQAPDLSVPHVSDPENLAAERLGPGAGRAGPGVGAAAEASAAPGLDAGAPPSPVEHQRAGPAALVVVDPDKTPRAAAMDDPVTGPAPRRVPDMVKHPARAPGPDMVEDLGPRRTPTVVEKLRHGLESRVANEAWLGRQPGTVKPSYGVLIGGSTLPAFLTPLPLRPQDSALGPWIPPPRAL